MKQEKLVIGRVDCIDLPEMNVENVLAKVDTGAYTSSIHCSEIHLSERDGRPLLCFHILDERHTDLETREFQTEKFEQKVIKNSFGQSEERYIITTVVRIFDREFETAFSLSNRADMRYPILLGRKFLNKQFVVDTARKNVSYKRKLKAAERSRAKANR
ncbi:Uncharacterized conserved protein [Catalinimonas alkaloidigena]|uniref:Uncharacterized conserved protein n=1 Tax=Catalinimonas alkaloidigena TaxID=1075417 RepID=A0A1G9UQ09_9BACT|nr:RimK/LysX family protein [Catalinimonas alkaloidigena]SDM61944.1 Uncharacterized conserved protein [Catalinimonas alkaloidigena]